MDSAETKKGSEQPLRRGFFQTLAKVGSAALVAVAGWKANPSRKLEAAPIPQVLDEPTGSVMLRMQADLEASLASQRTPSWLMVVDTRKCIGCNACTVACRAENPTGPSGNFRRVVEITLKLGARPVGIYKPFNCLQCDDPPCLRAVPNGMISKRPDGVVVFDHARLKGPYAQAAAMACPFDAVHVDDGKTFTEATPHPQAYEERSFIENGIAHRRKPGGSSLQDSARKCTFCSHLLDAGVLPACVTTCIGGAMYFGDANNPKSLINEITDGRRVFRGHQNFGVKPRVIYFEEPLPEAPSIDCSVCHS